MNRSIMRSKLGAGAAAAVIGIGTWAVAAGPASASSIEQKDPTVHSMDMNRAAKGEASRRPRSSPQLTFHGGSISADPHVFIVYWGSQWGTDSVDVNGIHHLSSDEAGAKMAPRQQQFLGGLYGAADHWSTSTTQYCQGVAAGTVSCGSAGTHVGHPSATPLLGVLADTGAAAPSQPTQSQLAQEAIKTANAFGALFNPATDQVIVTTFSHNNSSGFGTQYCAWHSSTSYSGGSLAYTNMPYLPDAGSSCGASFVNSGSAGALDGVSIVGGHEYGETITDMFPNGGWLDSSGGENGDKCAWISSGQGASQNVTISSGTFPVQSLWSNAFNSGAGGCVVSY